MRDHRGGSRNAAADYVQDLQALRQKYRDEARAQLETFFKRRDRKPPEEFQDSSFLYIRSYDADQGVRPFSGIDHWYSPDLTLSPLSSPGAYTTSLIAGETYLIRCWLRNRGDLAVPSAKVELFLTDPTLGFDTRFAANLTRGNVPSTWVGAGANGVVDFTWTVPPSQAGHKCLFARAFSFSPLELPVDDHLLDPLIDRHVAQQNLHIVGQAQAYSFAVVHAPNARLRIELRALQPEQLFRLRHPVLADITPAAEFPRRGWARLARLELSEPGGEVALTEAGEGIGVVSKSRQGIDLKSRLKLTAAVRDALRSVNAGESGMASHRELLSRFRRMNAQQRRSVFTMTIPDLGLRAGQAVGLNVTSVEEGAGRAEVVGGITLLIVGG